MLDLTTTPEDLLILRLLPPYAESDEASYLEALRGIGERTEPFALMTVFAGGGALSREGERAQALWYKATRAQMNRTCRALAIVRPGASEATVGPFRRLWSFPILATEDEEAARAFLLDRLKAVR